MDPNNTKQNDGLEEDGEFFSKGITRFEPEEFSTENSEYPDHLKASDLTEYLLYKENGAEEKE
jgi:hypothetical protein